MPSKGRISKSRQTFLHIKGGTAVSSGSIRKLGPVSLVSLCARGCAVLPTTWAFLSREVGLRKTGTVPMILRPNDLSCAWTAVKTFFNFESRQVAFKDRRVSFGSFPPEARLRLEAQRSKHFPWGDFYKKLDNGTCGGRFKF